MSIGRAINDPTGVWGNTPQGGNQAIVMAKNDSGAALSHGDVVVWDIAEGEATVTTTTSANSARVAGVVSVTGDGSTNAGTVADQAACPVCVGGVARVNIGGQTTANNGVLGTFTDAGEADDTATAVGTVLGVALEASTAKDANDCILAIITRA